MRNSLARFIREVCACWAGNPDEECLGVDVYGKPFRKPGYCRVMQSKPCLYFRKCALGPEDAKYPHSCFVQDPAFEKRVRKQYKKIDHTVAEPDEVRRCPDCGAGLRPRQKYCDQCRIKRRRKTSREYKRKYRKRAQVQCPTV